MNAVQWPSVVVSPFMEFQVFYINQAEMQRNIEIKRAELKKAAHYNGYVK